MVVTLGQQYNVGEKPTVILYTYINRHAEPSSITKLYTNIGAWVNSKMSERNPPLYCTITLIAMQGHQKNKDKRHDKLGLQLNLLHSV